MSVVERCTTAIASSHVPELVGCANVTSKAPYSIAVATPQIVAAAETGDRIASRHAPECTVTLLIPGGFERTNCFRTSAP